MVSVGPSGALHYVGGSLDANTAVLSFQAASETLALKKFTVGLALPTTGTQPTCSATTRNYFWTKQGNGTSTSDSLQVCILTSSGTYSWHTVF
jgi:hypothetical protein